MHGEIMIGRDTNSAAQTAQAVADLNALFLMVTYVELELGRIAPECASAASRLRCSISNEMLLRNPSWICLVGPSRTTQEEGDL